MQLSTTCPEPGALALGSQVIIVPRPLHSSAGAHPRSRRRGKANDDTVSQPSTRRQPLFYFPPPAAPQHTARNGATPKSTSSRSLKEVREEIAERKRWVEFDFEFAKKHFEGERQVEEDDGMKLTAKERIERYNERNRVFVETRQTERGKNRRGEGRNRGTEGKEVKEGSAQLPRPNSPLRSCEDALRSVNPPGAHMRASSSGELPLFLGLVSHMILRSNLPRRDPCLSRPRGCERKQVKGIPSPLIRSQIFLSGAVARCHFLVCSLFTRTYYRLYIESWLYYYSSIFRCPLLSSSDPSLLPIP